MAWRKRNCARGSSVAAAWRRKSVAYGNENGGRRGLPWRESIKSIGENGSGGWRVAAKHLGNGSGGGSGGSIVAAYRHGSSMWRGMA